MNKNKQKKNCKYQLQVQENCKSITNCTKLKSNIQKDNADVKINLKKNLGGGELYPAEITGQKQETTLFFTL